tara:strand:+ start:149 stop:421 length:273 start_codon:yes stop_codon:yes gene_type:complete
MKKVESTVSDNEVKVSDEQLSQLQKFDSDFNQIKLNLGHLELSKANLIDFNKEIQTKYEVLRVQLQADFGDNKNIDLVTGLVTDVTEEVA